MRWFPNARIFGNNTKLHWHGPLDIWFISIYCSLIIYLLLKLRFSSLSGLGEEFEDTKGVIKIQNRRTDNTTTKRKRAKGQETIYKTLQIILKIV